MQTIEQKRKYVLTYWEKRLNAHAESELTEPQVKYAMSQIHILKVKLGLLQQNSTVAKTPVKQQTATATEAKVYSIWDNRVIDVYRLGKAKYESNKAYKDNHGAGKAAKNKRELLFVSTLKDEPGRVQKLEQGKEAAYYPATDFKFVTRNTTMFPKPTM